MYKGEIESHRNRTKCRRRQYRRESCRTGTWNRKNKLCMEKVINHWREIWMPTLLFWFQPVFLVLFLIGKFGLYFLFLFLEFVLPGAALVSDLGRVVVETETEKRQTGQYRDQNPQSEDWALNSAICHFLQIFVFVCLFVFLFFCFFVLFCFFRKEKNMKRDNKTLDNFFFKNGKK